MVKNLRYIQKILIFAQSSLIGLFVFVPNLHAEAYNILRATQDALQNDGRISSANADISAIEEQKNQAKSAFLPQISTISSFGQNQLSRQNKRLITASNPSGKDFGLLNGRVFSAGLRVDQKIYDFGRTNALVSRADSTIKQSKIHEREVKQTVMIEVINAYLSVLEAKESEKLFLDSKNINQEQLAIAQYKYDHNELRANIYNQIKSRISQSAAEYLTASAELKIAISTLEQLTNKELKDAEFSYDKINQIIEYIGTDPQSAKAQAEQFSLAINAQKALVDVARADKSYNEAGIIGFGIAFPDISLSATRSTTLTAGVVIDNNTAVVVNANTQIYDGGVKSSRLREAENRLLSANYGLSDTINKVNLDIHNIHRRIDAASDIGKEWLSAANQLKLTMGNLTDAMELGAVTFIEYLNALDDYNKAKIQVIKNNIQIYRLKFQLMQLTGILTEETLSRYEK